MTGVGGIPAGAVAVTGNVTVTQQEAVGFVAVTPTATNSPPSSTINIPLNDNRANNLTVPLSSTGTLSATYGAATGKKTHLIFDVTGYFLADDTGATFSPLAPVRVLDTRAGPGQVGLAGTFANSVPRTLQIAGTNGVPADATAITGNLTVTQQSAGGFLAITKDPIADPATSTLNFPVSDNRANGVFAPLDGLGGAVDRVQGHGRRPHPRHPRRDRLLRAGHGRPALRAAQPGPDHGHPAGCRAVAQDQTRSTPAPPGRSTWPATGACRSGPRRSPAT